MTADVIWSLPADWYWRDDVFECELGNIFRKEWQWVALEQETSRPGDVIRVEVGGQDLLIARAEGGELNAFHNVCRHRGSKLVLENGNLSAFACPYHGWRYDLDGSLLATPRFPADALDFDSLGLLPAAKVETWMGLVFANCDENAPPLRQWLGQLGAEAEAAAPGSLVHETNLTADVRCNWKTYVDNYNEAYHVPALHPALNRDLLIDEYYVENAGGVSMHRAKAREGVNQPGVFGLRFPNFAFITYFDGVCFLRIEPLGPRDTRLFYSHFRPESISSDDFKSTIDYAWQVSKEDQMITPLVQQNLEGGIYQQGPLSPRHENGVAYFQQLVREAIGDNVG